MTETSTTTRDTADVVAAVLEHVADLIVNHDLPVPTAIRTSGPLYGRPVEVQVDDTDLGAWLIALDVVQPTWTTHDNTPKWEHAEWPADTFAGHAFAVTSCRFVAEAVA